jgi:hypothetical protein
MDVVEQLPVRFAGLLTGASMHVERLPTARLRKEGLTVS